MKKLLFSTFLLIIGVTLFAQIRVACVGNSITFGATIEGRDSLSYPAQLGKILGAEWDVKNFGVSGTTMLKRGNNPYWKQPQYQAALDFNPHVVIIKLGTNDSKPFNWDTLKTEFVNDYNEMIANFKKAQNNPIVIIGIPAPVIEDRWGIRKEIVQGELSQMVVKIAADNNLEIIDFYTALKNHPELFPDKIHPNAQGAAIMANEVAKQLNEIKSELQKK